MEEVWSSILHSSTAREATAWSPPVLFLGSLAATLELAGYTLGGLVAGEGSFYRQRRLPPYADGTERQRFVFALEMAERDAPLVAALRGLLQAGSSTRRDRPRPNEQPTVDVRITSNRQHLRTTVPFMDRFLLPGAKRVQYDAWRSDLLAYLEAHPTRWGRGPSVCSEPDCTRPVRGRGLCRAHYYRATGY